MPKNQKQRTRFYKIIGAQFGQGVVSALRAYPSIVSVTRITAITNEQLLVEVNMEDETMNIRRLSAVIARAGGQVKSICQVVNDANDNAETKSED